MCKPELLLIAPPSAQPAPSARLAMAALSAAVGVALLGGVLTLFATADAGALAARPADDRMLVSCAR